MWFPASVLRELSCGETGRSQLQAPGFLPQLRRQAHSGSGSTSGGRGLSRAACSTVGTQFPYPLRFLFATRPEVMGKVLGIVYRVISTHLIRSSGFTRDGARSGAVTLLQRFGILLPEARLKT